MKMQQAYVHQPPTEAQKGKTTPSFPRNEQM
jgi:hypothetical protein